LISRERSCRRKLRHLNYFEALQHATKVPRNETVIIYPCGFCQGLHVGHSIQANKLMQRLARTERRIARVEGVLPLTPDDLNRQQQSLRDLRRHLARLKAKQPASSLPEAISRAA
jgi:hypothetical protein